MRTVIGQMSGSMNSAQPGKVWYEWERLYSSAPARFSKYGETDKAKIEGGRFGDVALDSLAMVAWNTALAESLPPTLQAVEIGLRNWLDRAAAEYSGNPQWLTAPPAWMHPADVELIVRASQGLEEQVEKGCRTSVGHDDLLATSSFSLWSNMTRNNSVWSALSRYRQGELITGTDRKGLHKVFDDIRNLRDRAYHLEPVYRQADLEAVYLSARKYLQILNPRLARLMVSIDRFEAVYEKGAGWQNYRERLYSHYRLHELGYAK